MKRILIALFILWIIIGVFNVLYNGGKTFSEYREWSPLTDAEKRYQLLGDLYNYIIFIKEHTGAKDTVLVYAKDGRMISLDIYYLYPQKVTTSRDVREFEKLVQAKTFTYVGIYDSTLPVADYEKIASYSSKKTHDYGTLYKKK